MSKSTVMSKYIYVYLDTQFQLKYECQNWHKIVQIVMGCNKRQIKVSMTESPTLDKKERKTS